MSLKLYKVKNKKVIPTDEIKLKNDGIYIILDKQTKRPKIWIWTGSNANIQDKYIAGASATKIKSKEKLYGATIEIVENGSEPKNFPIISEDNLIKSLKKDDLKVKEEIEIENSINEVEEVKIIEPSKIDTSEGEEPIFLLKEQLKELLNEISESLTNYIIKIKKFSERL